MDAIARNAADLVAYAIEHGMIDAADATYCMNRLLDDLDHEPDGTCIPENLVEAALASKIPPLEQILKALLDDAVARGVIDDGIASRDLFDTRLMDEVVPRPSEVIKAFWDRYEDSPEAATDYFYRLARDSDYIRTYRVALDRKWVAPTPYGDLDITINLSKPEKDPKAIAAALNRSHEHEPYPRCQLCYENEGYRGRLDHPARETIRLIPLTLAGEPWYMQYSPYVYYNEHCIVLSREHTPMRIDHKTFVRLLEFVTTFPHYTLGSNADLPIVGGSILTHEHYQGGRYTFAMARAGLRKRIAFDGFDDVEAGIVEWPMSVIRLDADEPAPLIALADKILDAWRLYSDGDARILAETDGERHNTITPIARRRGARYELDLVLRNNRTTEEYPLGIFHPHAELHHIKKENIGLIEVMGLAVLPSRLLGEMDELKDALLAGRDPAEVPSIASHAEWAREIIQRHPQFMPGVVEELNQEAKAELDGIIEQEIGAVFMQVLEQCAVFSHTTEGQRAFDRFLATL